MKLNGYKILHEALTKEQKKRIKIMVFGVVLTGVLAIAARRFKQLLQYKKITPKTFYRNIYKILKVQSQTEERGGKEMRNLDRALRQIDIRMKKVGVSNEEGSKERMKAILKWAKS
jgi:hypothetical protein